jgi:hypothetical protein
MEYLEEYKGGRDEMIVKTYHGSIVAANESAAAAGGANASEVQYEDQPYSFFTRFLRENPKIGYLVFDVHENSPVKGRVPVPNARITVSRNLGGGFYFTKIVETDENGETEPIPLPTVSREYSQKPGGGQVSTDYQASVEAPGYTRQDIYYIHIFDGITTNQHVALQPNGDSLQPGGAPLQSRAR